MNEPIKKIVEENLYVRWDSDVQDYVVSSASLEELEALVKAVVRECIEKAKSVGDLRGANDDVIYGADLAALQISKHFGV